jgi:hypothetical protein
MGEESQLCFKQTYEIQIWTDYSPKPDAFKDVKSSFHYRNTSSLNIMWKEFSLGI